MSKLDRKKARDRRKAIPQEMRLAEVPRKTKDGRTKRDQSAAARAERAEDPRKAVLDARCRREGKAPTAANRRAADDRLSASGVGLAIRDALCAETAMAAMDAWQGYDAAMARYERTVLGQTIHPKGQRIEMEPERIQSETHHTVDTRTEDQRAVDATDAWERWRGYADRLAPDATALIRLARTAGDDYWWDPMTARSTHQGRRLACALRDLSDVVADRH